MHIFDIVKQYAHYYDTNVQNVYHKCITKCAKLIYRSIMKTYVIKPVDDRVAKIARNVWVVNAFKEKGFVSQKKFLTIVHMCHPELNNDDDIKNLKLFWLMRNQKHVDVLENLINKL